ncbi:tryptophan halogenase family protein [Sphingomonas canadensis]|uniref:Tryptophan halogenase family protein n=1 Tax=Sphingomonas canadensis TaxID=1219257 RepID=A0ABW3H836_9SPHN|nr:tryptophan halogenase family protein [Sphingomonas canadensis]MCW3835712.1 tryptophan 7-halogenase [Sphingomonas canadensis]
MLVKRILIVGGGTAGWMTAAALAHKLGSTPVEIRLIESAEVGTVGVGEATVPHIRHYNATLGFDEAEFMARTQGTFKLGIEFVNWGRIGDSYIHPFGAFGGDIGGVPFHHQWLRMRQRGPVPDFEAFSLPVQAARRGRFRHPGTDPASPLNSYNYAYQFDAGLYARFLREYAEARGVQRKEGKVVDAALEGESGFVRSVTLENGEKLKADLFVDCSGFRGLLIEQALKTGYEEWTHWLPCDRAIALPCANEERIAPFTRATAQKSGWVWKIPLQHRCGNGHVYSSGFLSDEDALETLLGAIAAPPMAEPNRLRFVTGKRRRQWVGNVVAIGLSSGFLEPLESTSIHLIQLAIGRLLDLFPTQAWDPLDAEEFNRLMAFEYERVRDFIILHYHATQRDDSDFWNHCRTMRLPDSLEYKMALFRERGVVVNYRDGMFLEPSWLAVYLGQRVLPRHADPLAEKVAEDQVLAAMAAMTARNIAMADGFPTHEAALAELAAAAAA